MQLNPIYNDYDISDDRIGYLKSRSFIDYQNAVERIIKYSKTPVSVADIHRRLGTEKRHWTLDAIEQIGAEPIGLLPTRYKMRKSAPATADGHELKLSPQKWNGSTK